MGNDDAAYVKRFFDVYALSTIEFAIKASNVALHFLEMPTQAIAHGTAHFYLCMQARLYEIIGFKVLMRRRVRSAGLRRQCINSNDEQWPLKPLWVKDDDCTEDEGYASQSRAYTLIGQGARLKKLPLRNGVRDVAYLYFYFTPWASFFNADKNPWLWKFLVESLAYTFPFIPTERTIAFENKCRCGTPTTCMTWSQVLHAQHGITEEIHLHHTRKHALRVWRIISTILQKAQ